MGVRGCGSASRITTPLTPCQGHDVAEPWMDSVLRPGWKTKRGDWNVSAKLLKIARTFQ